MTSTDINEERRKRAFLGNLPNDFLRVGSTADTQDDADQQAAIALHRELNAPVLNQPAMGRLNITVDQAKLVKNYGFARMDPYVRLRVGHCVYETHTDTNGGKNPRWNKVVQCLVPPGIKFINIEIYDERSFTMDELIAWTQIPIPPSVFKGETHEEWFPLSGKQGDGLEGSINLVLSYVNGPGYQSYSMSGAAPVMMVPRTGSSFLGYGTTYTSVPVYSQPIPLQATPSAPQQASPVDMKLIEEMFPNIDKEVIKSVFDANGGNKDAAINSLLQISQ